MDWAVICLTAAVSWFVFLLATDIVAIVKVSPSLASRAHSVTFLVLLAAIGALGYVVAAESHGRPCAQKVRLH